MGIYFSSLVFEPTSFQLMSSYLGFTYRALASINYIDHIGCHCPLPGTLGGLKLLKCLQATTLRACTSNPVGLYLLHLTALRYI